MQNLIKLPGLIDVHVHLREPGATQKEDFQTGTRAAIAGGYTAVLDMPNNPIATVTPQALQEKINLATGKIYCDVGFNFGAGSKSVQYFPEVVDKVFGLKVYMNQTTGDLLIEDEIALEAVFSGWPKNQVVMVHAEGDTLQKAIALAKKFGNKLHVCHVSLKAEVEAIKSAKQTGMKISCECTCHHLFLTDEDVKRLGPYGMMRPPLSSKEDQQALWQGITDGTIDMIASDHAPHTREEKEGEKPAYGVPGLETTLPLLLTAVKDKRLSLDKLIDLTYTNPKRVFNIPDQPDTFVEVDTTIRYTLDAERLYTKCRWTPFAGMKVTGKVKKVVLRGQTVFDGQNIFGPYGQLLTP
ncbi:MAG: amidohydrolase family protein [Candidatus Daviesbacteria bacterium]|nr:amidohydrolase family protein [Candidatus Daviesbacteria bacterium]